jgi:hypothetical protein
MLKSIFIFGFLASSLVMLAVMPLLNNNISNTAMAQGYDDYIYGDNSYYSKYPTDDKKYECRTGPFEGFFVSSVEFCKKDFPKVNDSPKPIEPPKPIENPLNVSIKKELFICNDAQTNTSNFFCFDNSFIIAGPNSGNYSQCTDQICFVNESDFGVQIFKDVAMIPSLSSEANDVNLNNKYIVAEDRIDKLIDRESECSVAGFSHEKAITKKIDQGIVQYLLCVDYEGDCSGSISENEEKLCTIKNYIVGGLVSPPIENGSTTQNSPLDTNLLIQNSVNNIDDKSNIQQIIPSITDLPF